MSSLATPLELCFPFAVLGRKDIREREKVELFWIASVHPHQAAGQLLFVADDGDARKLGDALVRLQP